MDLDDETPDGHKAIDVEDTQPAVAEEPTSAEGAVQVQDVPIFGEQNMNDAHSNQAVPVQDVPNFAKQSDFPDTASNVFDQFVLLHQGVQRGMPHVCKLYLIS